MVAFSFIRRKAVSWILAGTAALSLAACDVPMPGGDGPSINPTRAVPVALLVPRSSGSASGVASALEKAARLAVNDLQGATIDLRVYDTGGTPTGAATAAQQAINEGARIFIGPLFAESAAAAGRVAATRSINVLAFSNNTAIAGGNVFILGNTFQNTANRLARYAARQGQGSVFIVHAQDPAEEIGRDAIARAVSASGGRVAGVASFPLSQQGVINEIPTIASQYRSSGANALFMTSGTTGALPFLADLLPENGVSSSNAQFIGLQRLDVPTSALSLRGIQGALFALPSPPLTQNFNSRYLAAYGETPNPVAGLAYDGIAAIGALVAAGKSDALTVDALTQGAGFAGVNGPFRLFPNGTNERGLAVGQVQNSQVVIVDPAPRSFGGAGF